MRRVNVFGSSGSGKTTVGKALAERLGVPFVEIDQLNWGRYPNWYMTPPDELRAAVDVATQRDAWVVDGSYGSVRDIVWSRADTVVWLDTPFPQRFARMLRRTIRRSLRRELIWGLQRENIRNAVFARDSLVWFMLRTERRRGRMYREWLARPEYAHLELVRLRSQAEIDAWLARI